MVLKQSLVNVTFYPIKRIDLILSVLYNDNIDQIKSIIADIIIKNGLFLKNPESIVKMNKIAQPDFANETRLYLAIRIWVNKEQFFTAGSIFIEALKEECDKKSILITIAQEN
jgi:small conductance mechanosensitive channel